MQNVKALFKNYSNITGVAFIYINHCNINNVYKMVLGGGGLANFKFMAEMPLNMFIFFISPITLFGFLRSRPALMNFLVKVQTELERFTAKMMLF